MIVFLIVQIQAETGGSRTPKTLFRQYDQEPGANQGCVGRRNSVFDRSCMLKVT